jgi:hypothetical protein
MKYDYKQQKAIAIYLTALGLKDKKFEIRDIFIEPESCFVNVNIKISNPDYYHKDNYLLRKRFLYRIMNNLTLELEPFELIDLKKLKNEFII